MSLIIGSDTTISTEIFTEEVRVVNNATLTVDGKIKCYKMTIESGKTIIQGTGEIMILSKPPPPSIFDFMINIIFIILILLILIVLIRFMIFELPKIY